jgi:uncharacterized membrane protein YozB (DUF420 family)
VFAVALGRGWRAIRHGDVEAHREWMIRAFAVCAGIATVRIVMAALDLWLTPRAVGL